MASCFRCGADITEKKPVRSTLCGCGAEVKVCLNCRHYDRSAPQQCREPQADWVREKDRVNFCDWFQLASAPRGTPSAGEKKDATSAFDSLFKK